MSRRIARTGPARAASAAPTAPLPAAHSLALEHAAPWASSPAPCPHGPAAAIAFCRTVLADMGRRLAAGAKLGIQFRRHLSDLGAERCVGCRRPGRRPRPPGRRPRPPLPQHGAPGERPAPPNWSREDWRRPDKVWNARELEAGDLAGASISSVTVHVHGVVGCGVRRNPNAAVGPAADASGGRLVGTAGNVSCRRQLYRPEARGAATCREVP